jgi:hypothetical protein
MKKCFLLMTPVHLPGFFLFARVSEGMHLQGDEHTGITGLHLPPAEAMTILSGKDFTRKMVQK